MKLFSEITNKVSGSMYVSSSKHVMEHYTIFEALKSWNECHKDDPLLTNMAGIMHTKYCKY